MFKHYITGLAVWCLLLFSSHTQAQTDGTLLLRVYNHETLGFSRSMRAIDASAYPAFLLIPAGAVTAGAANIKGYTLQQGYEVFLASAGTYILTETLKRSFKRLRPYQARQDVLYYRGEKNVPETDSYSLPSGHTAMAFANATILSLQSRKWYVAVPMYAWAGGMALSRMWNGVHYPSDVAAGAVLGTAVAYVVYRLSDRITPKSFQENPLQLQVAPVGFSFKKTF